MHSAILADSYRIETAGVEDPKRPPNYQSPGQVGKRAPSYHGILSSSSPGRGRRAPT